MYYKFLKPLININTRWYCCSKVCIVYMYHGSNNRKRLFLVAAEFCKDNPAFLSMAREDMLRGIWEHTLGEIVWRIHDFSCCLSTTTLDRIIMFLPTLQYTTRQNEAKTRQWKIYASKMARFGAARACCLAS